MVRTADPTARPASRAPRLSAVLDRLCVDYHEAEIEACGAGYRPSPTRPAPHSCSVLTGFRGDSVASLPHTPEPTTIVVGNTERTSAAVRSHVTQREREFHAVQYY